MLAVIALALFSNLATAGGSPIVQDPRDAAAKELRVALLLDATAAEAVYAPRELGEALGVDIAAVLEGGPDA